MKPKQAKIYAEALYGALEGKADIAPIISNFLKLLKDKGQLHLIGKIIKEFEAVYNQKNNISTLKIKSAFPISKKTAGEIASALNIEKYELEMEIDKELIGGFTAQYGDNLINASFKNNLEKLHRELKK